MPGEGRVPFETMRMRGPDHRSLAAPVIPAMPRPARVAALDVQASIAIVVRSSVAIAETGGEPVPWRRLPRPAMPAVEPVHHKAPEPHADVSGQRILPGDVRAAYGRRSAAEYPHRLDLLV